MPLTAEASRGASCRTVPDPGGAELGNHVVRQRVRPWSVELGVPGGSALPVQQAPSVILCLTLSLWQSLAGIPRPSAQALCCFCSLLRGHKDGTRAHPDPGPAVTSTAPGRSLHSPTFLHSCILKPRLRCPLLSHPCHRSASVESCPSHGLWSLPPSCPCPVPARSGCCAPHPSFVIKLTLRKPHI